MMGGPMGMGMGHPGMGPGPMPAAPPPSKKKRKKAADGGGGGGHPMYGGPRGMMGGDMYRYSCQRDIAKLFTIFGGSILLTPCFRPPFEGGPPGMGPPGMGHPGMMGPRGQMMGMPPGGMMGGPGQ